MNHDDMKQLPQPKNIERKVINVLLSFCLLLGFVTLLFDYLPRTLSKVTLVESKNFPIPSKNLDQIVPLPHIEEISTNLPSLPQDQSVYARFVPEAPASLPQAIKEEPLEATSPSAPLDTLATSMVVRTRKLPPSSLVNYSPAGASRSDDLSWLIPPQGLEHDVAFWRDIYAQHTSHHIVMHDAEHLDIVFNVLDVSDITKSQSLTEQQQQEVIEQRIAEERTRIELMLTKIAGARTAKNFTDEEWRIRKLYQEIGERHDMTKAINRIRAQRGLKDKFFEGLARSGLYLGEIERIFETEEIPKPITRLIFVESMFDPMAHSSAGARGLWQIMEGTGRHYGLRVTNFIDERLDPIEASYAAARLLKENYQELGSWPLAINAYNAGRGRLRQATQQLGTTRIETIIQKFEHPGYGFASRNFFLEFLAAVEVVEHASLYFGEITYREPAHFDEIRVDNAVPLASVARSIGMTIEHLRELNPILSPKMLSGESPLPAGWLLRIPAGNGDRFAQAISGSPSPNL